MAATALCPLTSGFLCLLSPAESCRPAGGPCGSPNPNNPTEYCSTIPPTQQASAGAPLPTVMVPTGVLKREGEFAIRRLGLSLLALEAFTALSNAFLQQTAMKYLGLVKLKTTS